MIKANELRIGNLVFNLWTQPISVDWGNIKWSQDVNAIPLTDDWLLKFGFEVKSHYAVGVGSYATYNFGKLSLLENLKGEFYFPALPFSTVINSVHQLQNLYFDLTGEELTA